MTISDYLSDSASGTSYSQLLQPLGMWERVFLKRAGVIHKKVYFYPGRAVTSGGCCNAGFSERVRVS